MLLPDENELRQMMMASPDGKVQSMSGDVAVIKSMLAIFAATLQLAAGDPTKGNFLDAGAAKAVAVTGLVASTANSNKAKVAEFVGSELLKSIGLRTLAGASPARAGVVVSLTLADKFVTAMGFADKNMISECQYAVASLATTTGLVGASCVGTAGLGCFVGALAVAGEILNTYEKCQAAGK